MRKVVKKEYVERVYTVYNQDYTNLSDACRFFDVNKGIFIITAKGSENYQSVVIANWDNNYSNKYVPNVIYKYNNGFSYKNSNIIGTIAFDLLCGSITVKLLSMY